MADQSGIAGRVGLSIAVQTRGAPETAGTLDAAVQVALARTTGHALITPLPGGPGFHIAPFGPAENVLAPPVVTFDSPTAVALALNGGQRLYLRSDPASANQPDPASPNQPDPASANQRWVDVPGLAAFYRLPDVDRERARNRWADRLSQAVPEIDRATARALPIPSLRIMLAHHGAAVFPVSTVRRGEPPVDAGGIVNGVTMPLLRLPLREPDCYLPVVGQVEGRLESINAWDVGAGASLGVIQFNADRGALFRFLWVLWTDDPDLFAVTLTQSLGWTMVWDGDHPDLVVGEVRLHGRSADKARNAVFLQTGKIDGVGRDGPHRRQVASALRDCVMWPHVQEMIVDTSAWYLQVALKDIRAEGIAPLNPDAPDHDTFVLTAILLSGAVRFSSCLRRLLTALRPWPSTADKLANWQQALATTVAPCPELLPRLKNQQQHAEQVCEQILRLLD
jgi:hypothetical protein